jgi:hypothetical protein
MKIPEEHIDDECIDSAFVVNIKDSPEVLKGLWGFLILHSKDELEESFVIHLSLESLILLINSIN